MMGMVATHLSEKISKAVDLQVMRDFGISIWVNMNRW